MSHVNTHRCVSDYFIAPRCELCDMTYDRDTIYPLCGWCDEALPRHSDLCHGCSNATVDSPSNFCAQCFRHEARLVTALRHDDTAADLVHSLKFAHSTRAARILSGVLVTRIQVAYAQDCLPQRIIPVPLSWRSRVRRGYNQADWLAHYAAGALRLPIGFRDIRRRHRASQRTLSRSERMKLPLSTFAVRRAPASHVAIIDDVYTTGATTSVLSKCLLNAGVKRVDVWCATKVV